MNPDNGRPSRKKSGHALFWIIFIEVVALLAGFAVILFIVRGTDDKDPLVDEEVHLNYIMNTEAEEETETIVYVPRPDIDEQLLTVNKFSRPGEKCRTIDAIVIHYLGNPRTTAQENHDYFESLKDLKDVSMSANYVIGTKGEIIQCVPDGEVAYASNSYNDHSISIENCHMTASGKLTKQTYASLVKLTAYLADLYDLDRSQIIRHYDVTGKICPKYFVEHPDAWEQFLDEVEAYRQECMDEVIAEQEALLAEQMKERETVDELTAFLETNALEVPEGE